MAETWDHLEDWEEWSPESGTSFMVHAAAGSLAGAAEHCAIFPMDTIKTHMQTEGAARGVVRKLVQEQGVLRLWRGVSTMFTACVPAHAAYFSIFEQAKMSFGADGEEHTPLAASAAGVLATVAHDSIMTPMDVIKQRLQLGLHSGMIDCASTILRTEGVSALFLSFPTTLLMNMPYAAVMVSANESLKKVLNPGNEYNLPAFFLSGALSGALAAAMTTPLDVVKTRLQTQSVMRQYLSSQRAAAAAAARSAGRSAGSGGASGAAGGAAAGASSSTAAASNSRMLAGIWSQGRTMAASAFPGLANFATPVASGRGFRHVGQPAIGVTVSPYYSHANKFNNLNVRNRAPFGPYVKGTTTATRPVTAGDGSVRELMTHLRRSRPAPQLLESSRPVVAPTAARAHSTAGASSSLENALRYRGLVDTVKRVYQEEGLRGFSRGLKPRLMVHAPSVAISWTTYETAKSFLSTCTSA
ncbi:Mitoferrin [Hondaea fermentalgiana]|uniref:Mitoferrin n=1 Tax=Hondaea fermentalgiana TaxID=2315210 RepID=A0A2R5G5R1_9STRA|nr:Mitoferrin [Hondaea fermentalgiana]|eukprot:GBG25875.1 Mitoferrin [Hondaea fermentalgiana]